MGMGGEAAVVHATPAGDEPDVVDGQTPKKEAAPTPAAGEAVTVNPVLAASAAATAAASKESSGSSGADEARLTIRMASKEGGAGEPAVVAPAAVVEVAAPEAAAPAPAPAPEPAAAQP
jgi:hypothetical protein